MTPQKWTVKCLSELTENFDSLRIPVKGSERISGKYPYYGASGIVDYIDKYIFDGDYLLVAEDGENLRTLKTPIAFLARGKFWVNNHAHIMRGNSEADTCFLAYALANADISGYLTGSTMPKLTQGNMNRIPILAPPLDEQKAIAHILGTLDDKIELNQQMNQTLEAIARAIFKSWFVDFDPVCAKLEGRQPHGMDAETAALFPDEFEDSAIDKIPKGWTFEHIRDRTSIIQYGLTQSASSDPVGPHFLRITDIRGGAINWSTVPFCKVSSEDYEKYKIKAGDIFVARTGASTGENIYIIEPLNAVFASYLVRFQFPDPAIARIVGAFMRTGTYFDYVAGAIGGSAQPNASAQVLAGASLVFPTKEVADSFYKAIHSADLLQSKNDEQSRTLASMRDALLPKLLSGELRVKDAEKLVEAVT